MTKITLPHRAPGGQSKAARAKYQAELKVFADLILEKAKTMSYKHSTRGWCYTLEPYGLDKGDFDLAQDKINECRVEGLIPYDLCAEDSKRVAEGVPGVDNDDPAEYAEEQIDHLLNHQSKTYSPYFFSDYQDYYIEMQVEKIDLVGLFRPICRKYHVPIGNAGGDADINSRVERMKRFAAWESHGKRCVLLYCGDLDPGGSLIVEKLMDNYKKLEKPAGWNPGRLLIDPFGLKEEFVLRHNLTWIDNLKTGSGGEIAITLPDGTFAPGKTEGGRPHPQFHMKHVQRYLPRFGTRKVEANALTAAEDAGRELCERAISKYINTDGRDQFNEHTRQARERLQSELSKRIQR